MNTITIINKETGERQELTPEQLSQFMSHMAAQIKAQQERIAELEAQVPKWQPIESVPRDSSIDVILYIPTEHFSGCYIAHWVKDHWQARCTTWIGKDLPTHWMPLPNLPKKEGDE